MGRLLSTHIQHLIITGAGVEPTIPNPVTSSPSDSTWVAATDIMQGEWAHNITDDIWYYRKADNTIKAFTGAEAASLAEVNAGTNLTKFVNPATFAGADKWDEKINHALATAANDFLVASGSGAFVKKTLAETKTILDIDNPISTLQLTQAEYDALTPDENTLYIIVG